MSKSFADDIDKIIGDFERQMLSRELSVIKHGYAFVSFWWKIQFTNIQICLALLFAVIEFWIS